jgi:phage tail tape-measure protein
MATTRAVSAPARGEDPDRKDIETASETYAGLKTARDARRGDPRHEGPARVKRRTSSVNVEMAAVDARVAGLVEKGREDSARDLGCRTGPVDSTPRNGKR